MKKPVFNPPKTISEKAARVTERYGKTLGASKGSAPPAKWKVKPKVSLKNGGTVGIKASWKF